jgi:hypothetical protein
LAVFFAARGGDLERSWPHFLDRARVPGTERAASTR